MKGSAKKAFESSVATMVQTYRQTGKIGKVKPKVVDKARQSALAEAFAEAS